MIRIEFTSERRDNAFGGWARDAKVGEREFQTLVRRGKRVRIAFKPRGQNIGWKWQGSVYERNRGHVWSGEVPGSIGVRGLLIKAGVIAGKDQEDVS